MAEKRQRGKEEVEKETEEKGEEKEEEKKEEEEEPKKKKSTTPKRKSGEEAKFEFGNQRFVTVREFKGKTYIDIREFYDANGESKPGKKGISITVEQWNKIKALIPQIDEAI